MNPSTLTRILQGIVPAVCDAEAGQQHAAVDECVTLSLVERSGLHAISVDASLFELALDRGPADLSRAEP